MIRYSTLRQGIFCSALIYLASTIVFAEVHDDEPAFQARYPKEEKQIESLKGSIQFSTYLANGGIANGHCTLLKIQKLDRNCRYVFLTAGHVLTGRSGQKVEKFVFASKYFPKVENIEVEIHPKMSLKNNRVSDDLALFAFEAACLPEEVKIAPFDVGMCTEGDCEVIQIGHFNPNDPLVPYRSPLVIRKRNLKIKATELASRFTLQETNPKNFGYSGDSGSAVFQSKDGKLRVVGCDVATTGSTPDFLGERQGAVGVCMGGKDVSEWIEATANKNRFATKMGKNNHATFPDQTIYKPMMQK